MIKSITYSQSLKLSVEVTQSNLPDIKVLTEKKIRKSTTYLTSRSIEGTSVTETV